MTAQLTRSTWDRLNKSCECSYGWKLDEARWCRRLRKAAAEATPTTATTDHRAESIRIATTSTG
eukprot:scaffold515554_cov18-Prasinocladus_malaysianus.AAC.1